MSKMIFLLKKCSLFDCSNYNRFVKSTDNKKRLFFFKVTFIGTLRAVIIQSNVELINLIDPCEKTPQIPIDIQHIFPFFFC